MRRRPSWRRSSHRCWRRSRRWSSGGSSGRPWAARIAAARVRSGRAGRWLARSAVADRRQKLDGDRPFVPRLLASRTDDRALVALAGEQHDVSGSCRVEGGFDGGAPVRDEMEALAATPAGLLGASGDLVEDGLAVLAPRVLVG